MKPALLAPLLLAAACGDSVPVSPDGAAATPDAAPGDAAPTYAMHGTVRESASPAQIVGARVCVADHPEIPCATTDATGNYVVQVPNLMGQAIAVVATAPDHLGSVTLWQQPLDTGGAHLWLWPSVVFLASNVEGVNLLGAQAGFTYPGQGTGFVQLRIEDASSKSLAGATVTMAPSSGKGPVYDDALGPKPALTATGSDGQVWLGDVAPGRYAITVTAPGKTCSVDHGGSIAPGDWPPTGAATTEIEVVADALTSDVNLYCQ